MIIRMGFDNCRTVMLIPVCEGDGASEFVVQ